ncbi:IS66 family transposase [Salininema proteolyticum]|uniref:IS66 family transposase n=1 Tax=Salininema proteolyticum TaxID=1607685 RepID=UPI00362FBB4E
MSHNENAPSYEELAALVVDLRRRLDAAEERAERAEARAVKAEARAAKAEARVAELEARLRKDSSNSSKPSSIDQFKKPAKKRSLRRKSNRKPGGQAGHEGRTLQRVAVPDRVVDHFPAACGVCEADLSDIDSLGFESRQMFDIPDPRTEVIEHRLHSLRCECGNREKAQAPEGVVAPVQYGPKVSALAAYLYEVQFVAKERVAETIEAVTGTRMSTATVEAMASRAAEKISLSEFIERVRAYLAEGEVLFVDETGIRVAGTLAWLHSASNETAAVFLAHPKRGKDAIAAMDILPHFTGVMHHDCWAPYDAYANIVAHQLRNAHALRELQAVCDAVHRDADVGDDCWSCRVSASLKRIKRCVEAEPGEPMTGPWYLATHLAAWEKAVDQGVAETANRGSPLEKKANNLATRLRDRREDYLRFVTDERAEFSNNAAERQVRMAKVKMKVSGGFRSWDGADRFAVLRSYVHTAQKHGKTATQALSSVFTPHIWQPAL